MFPGQDPRPLPFVLRLDLTNDVDLNKYNTIKEYEYFVCYIVFIHSIKIVSYSSMDPIGVGSGPKHKINKYSIY